MDITVELYGVMRDAVGERTVTVDAATAATVEDVLSTLATESDGLGPLVFDSKQRVRPNVTVSVGETPVREREGATTTLEEGDTLIVAPSVAGG